MWEICTSPDSSLGVAAVEYTLVEVIRVGLGDQDVIQTLDGTARKKVSDAKICERITRRDSLENLMPVHDLLDYNVFAKIEDAITHGPGCSIHGSLSCTAFSLM